MKYDIKEKIIISYGEEYDKFVKLFAKQEKKFDEKQHMSLSEEIKRVIKTTCKAKLNINVEEAFEIFLDLSSKDINRNLEAHDLSEGTFYISSKKTEKVVIRISELIKNELIEIVWYTKTHKFIRRIIFIKCGKNKTKFKYEDIVKSMVTVFGFIENYKKDIYQKNIRKSFKVQILSIKILNEDNKDKIKSMEEKILKLSRIK